MEPKSPPDLRILQFVTSVLDDPDSLEAINTHKVMDRAIVAVKENNTLYMLRRESTTSPSGTDVVEPSSGPGRWFVYPSSGSSDLPIGGMFFLEEGNMEFGDTTLFALPDSGAYQIFFGSGSGFTLPDASEPVMLYTGPTKRFVIHADMAMSGAGTESETSCSVGIAQNGDIIGQPINSAQSRAFGSMPITVPTDAPSWLHSTRILDVEDGDEISFALCTDDSTSRTVTAFNVQFYEAHITS